MKQLLTTLMFFILPSFSYAQVYQEIYNATAVTGNSTGTTAVDLKNNPIVGDYAVEVTNTAGTDPTLDITWQMSRDGVTWWDLATVSQFTATGKTGTHITSATTQVLPKLRLKYTITGTDTPTWNIKAWVIYTPQSRI